MGVEKAREYVNKLFADREQRKNKRRVVTIFTKLLRKYDIPFNNSDIEVNESALKHWLPEMLCKLVLPGSNDDRGISIRLTGIGGKTWTGETPKGKKAATTLDITRMYKPNQYATLSISQCPGAPDEYELWIQEKQASGSLFQIQQGTLNTRVSNPDRYSKFFGVDDLSRMLTIDVPATLEAFVNQPIDPEDPRSLVPIVMAENNSTEA